MREIKFRGWSKKHNQWFHGYFANVYENFTNGYNEAVKTEEHPSIFNSKPGERSSWGFWQEVDPESVGQFTGLRDKNFKEIYEGDIIKAGEEREYIEVRFVRGVFAFLWGGNLDDEFPTGSPTHEWAEVIGNIYENPKLIKRK